MNNYDDIELRNMVKEMLDADDKGFSDWEINFLDDMLKWSGSYRPKQAEKIELIYKKKM